MKWIVLYIYLEMMIIDLEIFYIDPREIDQI